jgi:hypothetical protein
MKMMANMRTDIHERLMQAKERLRHKQKLGVMLHEAQAIAAQEAEKCSQHEKILAREKSDVEKLEGFNLTGLFYSVLGTKEERLETERQEYLAAKLKHEESLQAFEDARQDVAKLQSEQVAFSNAVAEYDRLIAEKEALLANTGDSRAKSLMDLTERLADLESDRKELEEAVRAGMTAERSLQQVRSELQSAQNWGTWDLLGGGTISTWAKHSKIDSAKRQAQIAQRHLQQFQEELADADQRLHISLGEIGGFSTFADFFFDGLIADWIVQSKVQNASEACDSAISRVTSALGECRRQLSDTEQAITKVTAERHRYIEQA